MRFTDQLAALIALALVMTLLSSVFRSGGLREWIRWRGQRPRPGEPTWSEFRLALAKWRSRRPGWDR